MFRLATRRAEPLALPRSSRTNADDRLPLASLGPVESGDGVVEGRDVADVRPQSSVTHPLDDLTQLGAIGHENKVDRQDAIQCCVPGTPARRNDGAAAQARSGADLDRPDNA